MKISLVTIARNNAEGLRRTLESVRGQSLGCYEHIIVDGESTDNTPAVIDKYGKGCRVIVSPPAGVYNAINRGLEVTTGDVIGLLHAGDTFAADDILQKVTDAFNNDSSLDFVYGNILRGNSSHRFSGARVTRKTLLRGYMPPHPSLYIRRQAAEQAGLYKEDYIIAADFDMMLKLFYKFDFKSKYLPLDMVVMDPGGMSTTLRSRLLINNRERLRALRENNLPASPFALLLNYFYRL